MSWRRLQMSITRTVVAITLLFADGAARASTISELNTNPSVGPTATNLVGHPVAVAVDQAGHLYVMTLRGWIFSLSGTFAEVSRARLPGPLGAPRIPATALAVTTTGDVYAGRSDGMIFHYNSALSSLLGMAQVTGSVVGLTVDGGGNVYAANGAGQIFKMNSSLGSPVQGTVTVAAGSHVVAIKAEISTGALYVAISDGTVYRLNSSLTTLATGAVMGTPVNIAADSAGNVIVATSTGLYKISQSIAILNSNSSLPNLVGVDLDSAGDVVTADSAGAVYVMNTALSSPRSTSSGVSPTRSIAINTTAQIYVVGGPDGASEGDPHLTTIDGVRYDFQSAGEFVLLRHTGDLEGPVNSANVGGPAFPHDAMEIQVRQFPVATTANTCVSLNSAVAARVGKHKVTYEPNLSGQPDPSGLQLRIDHTLITLDPNGMRLGDGGRIVPTSTPGGLEVDFPDDTVLFVTPGWWASQSKWYLNVNVVPQQRARGLVGNVPERSWLPALPDGTSMGPAPTSAHQRYVELYGRFADAWRVTDKTSLFDYAPGTSTDTFTMRGWPPETGGCDIPGTVRAGGATEEVAREACKGVPGDPANCIFDVKVTGLANIANTYAASRNVQPVPETGPKCNCPNKSGGGGIAVFTLAALLAAWTLMRVWRRNRTVSA
jgi:hypothetical protein